MADSRSAAAHARPVPDQTPHGDDRPGADASPPRQPQADPQAKPQAPPHGAPGGGDPRAAADRKQRRNRLFGLLGAVVAVAAIGYFLYWLLVASHYVSTDDAYVGADLAQVTPQVPGAIQEVRVAETQAVKKGDVLVVIDPADARLQLAQAQSDFNRAVRQTQQTFVSNDASAAVVGARQADVGRAHAEVVAAQAALEKAQIDLRRRQLLQGSGAVSGEELTNAQNAFASAQANLAAAHAAEAQSVANLKQAQAQLRAAQAITAGTTVQTNPQVTLAKAALDTAQLNLDRTVIRAPIDGVVAKKQVQVGQRVQVGQQLMTVVPVQNAYVDANFKEVQLRKVRVGLPATVHADIYGGKVDYRGCVAGFSGGTGSAFSIIPAQNATGNWIKVVQRLPVRIHLDPKQLREHPLRVGLSTAVKVDVNAPANCRF